MTVIEIAYAVILLVMTFAAVYIVLWTRKQEREGENQ